MDGLLFGHTAHVHVVSVVLESAPMAKTAKSGKTAQPMKTKNRGAAFFDLDRTLLRGASGPIITGGLRSYGLVSEKSIPGESLLFGVFNVIGETLPSMALTRQGARAAKGWSVKDTRAAAASIAQELVDAVEPFAREVIADHKAAGRSVVLATTTPIDLVRPFAELLGMDDVLATHYRLADDGTYDGTIDGEFVWNRGKAREVAEWARANEVDLAQSYAYSDSIFDVPLLSSVGNPVAVNPDPRLFAYAKMRRWETVWFNAPPGVPKPLGVEPQDVVAQLVRPEFIPWMRFDMDGVENIPEDGGVILASNHRSYVDPLVVSLVAAKDNRPARFLSKKEVTDAPVVGPIVRSLGAIRVDREGDTADSTKQAATALRAGELIALFPQGTIPRGEKFFEPDLEGRYGAIRLALETDRPLIPMALWGTEKAWPRNRKLPYLLNLADPPVIRVRVGKAYRPTSNNLDEAIAELMSKIQDLLPEQARHTYVPTKAELAATQPASTKS